ncbi:coenzyme Q-binding protein COQ10 homolog A, mitochondrial [Cloeon dipterum]|uniref:coenzyme Q-binding protein COQ10 homolog A, mitochondrial n=1 Tax=Cloeon dipterum TaxID=197152 RepID=UPI00322081BC
MASWGICKNANLLRSSISTLNANSYDRPSIRLICSSCTSRRLRTGLQTHQERDGQRTLFTFPGTSKKKEYQGKKLVGYSMDQMFEVVSDVEHYRDFVPFCQRSLVTLRTPDNLRAELVIGFPPVRESYVSNVKLVKPTMVRAVCTEGKLFNHLVNFWRFYPGLKGNERSCVIDFSVSFEFRSLLHSQLAHLFFNELVRQMEKAFVEEAERRFGKASVKTKLLSTSNAIQAGS